MDGVPVASTGEYYYADPGIVGLVSTEDMVVMMDEMGIATGTDVGGGDDDDGDNGDGDGDADDDDGDDE